MGESGVMTKATRCLATLLLGSTAGQAAPPIDPGVLVADLVLVPWDPWTLLDARLANRKLIEQLDRPDQSFRLFAGQGDWVVAVDGLTGSQLPPDQIGVWHGFFVADVFSSGRVAEGIDLSLNLTVFNRSASNGYRRTSDLRAGFAGHLYETLGHPGGEPLQGEFLALDLGPVTLGQGLFLEHTEIEGMLGRLVWGELWFRVLTAGQLHAAADDLVVATAGFGPSSLSWLVWSQSVPDSLSHYLTLSGELLEISEDFRAAGEVATRLPDDLGSLAWAAMARVDWIPPPWRGLRLHLGHQTRWYGQGIGPSGDRLSPTSVEASTPHREDTYVTNPFLAWRPSAWYRQWWHTVMVEVEWSVFEILALRGELEAIRMSFDDPTRPARRMPAPQPQFGQRGGLLPAPQHHLFYRAGLEVRPRPGQPHRLRLWLANKVLDSSFLDDRKSTHLRVVERDLSVAFELEIFL